MKFCVSKWVGLDNKNSLKRLALTVKGLNREGLLSEGFLRMRFGGGGLLSEFYGIVYTYLRQQKTFISKVNDICGQCLACVLAAPFRFF